MDGEENKLLRVEETVSYRWSADNLEVLVFPSPAARAAHDAELAILLVEMRLKASRDGELVPV